jgi:tetratricopeptide (TPR) repeat protein
MATSLGRARSELTELFEAIGPAGRARAAGALEPLLGAAPRGLVGQRTEALVAAVVRPGINGAAVLRELRRACPAELRRIDRVASRCLPLPERVGRVAPSLPPLRRFQGMEAALAAAHAALDRRASLWIVGPPGSGRLSFLARLGRDRLAQHSLVWTVRGPDPARCDYDLAELGRALGLAPEAEETRRWLAENDDWLILLVGASAAAARIAGPGVVACTAVVAPPVLLVGGAELSNVEAHPLHENSPGHDALAAPPATVEPHLRLAYSRAPGHPAEPSGWSAEDAAGGLWSPPEPVGPPVQSVDECALQLDEEGPSPLERWLERSTGVAGGLHTQVAALLRDLEPEEQALLRALAALGPAPVALNLFDAPRLDGAPSWLVPLLRSRFTVDGAARRLVGLEIARRDGGGLWLSDAARAAVLACAPPEPALDATLAALIGLIIQEDPLLWMPHLHPLAARLPAAVRAPLLGRAGRALSEREPARARRYLGRALEGPGLEGEARASVQNDLGVLLRRAGDPRAARRLLQDALGAQPASGAAAGAPVAGLWYHLGLCELDLGLSEEAERSFTQGLAALAGGRPSVLSAMLAMRAGERALARGELEAAAGLLETARRDLQRAGGAPMRAVELEMVCAELAERRGSPRAALAHAERAWDLARGLAEDAELKGAARALLERLDP